MAFPTVQSTLKYGFTRDSSDKTLDFTSDDDANSYSPSSGELILILSTAEQGAGGSFSTPTGYTELFNYEVDSADGSAASWYKTSDGTETSVTIPNTTTTSGAFIVQFISGWNAIEISGSPVTSFGGSVDPPSVTASWGSDDNLFISFLSLNDDVGIVVNGAPTNYSNLVYESEGVDGLASTVATARREIAAASDDPDTGWSWTEGNQWHLAETIVIQPETSRILAFDQGSYSYTFQNVNLPQTHYLGFAQGSYSYTMQVVNLLRNLILEFEPGEYTYSTNDVILAENEFMSFGQGSYSYTMQDVGLLQNFKLTFDQGSYALTMSGVELLRNLLLSVEQGSYTLTMGDVELLEQMVLRFEQGDYTLTMGDVVLTLIAVGATSVEKLALSSPIDTTLAKESTISTTLAKESPISTLFAGDSSISQELLLSSTISTTLPLNSEIND